MKEALKRATVAIATGVLCLFAAANAEARPGQLVPGFGERGILKVDASAASDSSKATVAVDSADRIVLMAAGGNKLVRLLPPGLPDFSFDGDGRVTLPDGSWESLALDPAGRIVVAGSVNRDLAVARYLPDGAPDASFSGDGVATHHLEPPPPKPIAPGVDRPPSKNPPLEKLNRVALDSDGSVVALGEIRNCFHGPDQCYLESNVVARFDPRGAVDAGFGNGGAVVLDLEALSKGSPGQVGAEFGRLALQPDGKVLIGGTNGHKLALLRLTDAGAFDPGFSGDGVFTTRLDTLSEREVLEIGMAKAILPRADGRIVLVGERTLLGLEPDGELDPSFGRKGSAPVEPPAILGAIAIPEGAAFDHKGRILVVGRDSSGSVVLRYFPQGRPDPRFARGGYAGLDLTRAEFSEAEGEAPTESLTDVALSSDGDVLAAGVVKPRERSPRRLLVVARYDGSDGHLAYCDGKLAVLQGTPGPDRLSAQGPVVAFGGDDRIRGSRAFICAGPGDDVLRGVGGQVDAGPGDDRVLVNFGGARVFGRAGDDELRTVPGEASVSLSGGDGADLLVGSASRDLLYGGVGADRLFGQGGRDRLFGGPGDDLLIGAGGTDRLFGGPGRNRLFPGPDGPPQIVYRGERPSLRISIVVRPGRISGLHIDVKMPCRDGDVLYSSSNWDDYDIPIRPDGSFAYHESRGWDSEHLRGKLIGDKIVGTYREASGMGQSRCITGYPGKQQLRFVARRGS